MTGIGVKEVLAVVIDQAGAYAVVSWPCVHVKRLFGHTVDAHPLVRRAGERQAIERGSVPHGVSRWRGVRGRATRPSSADGAKLLSELIVVIEIGRIPRRNRFSSKRVEDINGIAKAERSSRGGKKVVGICSSKIIGGVRA